MRTLDLTHDGHKFLKNLAPKQFKQVTGKILSLLREPFPQDCIHVSGHPGVRRVDTGEYRICYSASDRCIEIIVVGIRNDDAVYKTLHRVSG